MFRRVIQREIGIKCCILPLHVYCFTEMDPFHCGPSFYLIACDCHPLGSNDSICEEYGGQCSCKPGVEGRDCSRCKPGFYNLTDAGCTRKYFLQMEFINIALLQSWMI